MMAHPFKPKTPKATAPKGAALQRLRPLRAAPEGQPEMADNVTRLPTAATSYITIRKARGGWDVVLQTPSVGKPLRTRLYGFKTREGAEAKGEEVAARLQRPFKGRAAR